MFQSLEVNVEKLENLVFKANRFQSPHCSVTLKGKTFIRGSALKYLGDILSGKVTIQDIVDRLNERLY